MTALMINKGGITNLSGSYHQAMESVNKEC